MIAEKDDTVVAIKNNHLYLSKSLLSGKGVFSNSEIAEGDIIEVCPLIIFTNEDEEFLKYTNLYNYYSLKSQAEKNAVLPLGFGAFYNHNSPSNAEYTIDLHKKTLTITAVKKINTSEEITINYNGNYNDNSSVTFVDKNEIYEFSVNLL